MSFYFARLQPDGRLTSPLPKVYATAKDAMDDAEDALRHVKSGAGKVVLVQVVADIELSFKTSFRDAKTQKEFTGKP